MSGVGNGCSVEHLLRTAQGADRRKAGSAANALKKLQESAPEDVAAYRLHLLRAAERTEVAEVRWNLVIVLGAMRWKRGAPLDRVIALLFDVLGASSVLERVCALTALHTLAGDHPELQPRVSALLAAADDDASAAMRARVRKLRAASAH